MTEAEKVYINKIEYERLLKDSRFLNALEQAGVDNWEGYSEAWRIMEEQYPEYLDT